MNIFLDRVPTIIEKIPPAINSPVDQEFHIDPLAVKNNQAMKQQIVVMMKASIEA
jgi:hypothetical protein